MTQSVLQKSKILCYFKIDKNLDNINDQLLQPAPLALTIYHFHYPSLYFPILHKHFAMHLPTKYTPNHLCLRNKGRQLSPELPIGLQVEDGDQIEVGLREQPVPDGFTMVKISWKKGYSIVNKDGGCDHVFKKIDQDQRKRLYQLHLGGHTHQLHKYPRYEGNCIAIKIYSEGFIIQRKEDQLHWTVSEYFRNRFKGIFNIEKGIWTHGVLLDERITLKELLENWNYNDGYCYLKVNV